MQQSKDPDYEEFANPKIANLYDTICPLGEDSDFFINTISDLGIKSIIDLGCGSGILTSKLAELGYEMTGIEPAKPMLDIARKRKTTTPAMYLEGSYQKLFGLNADVILMTSHVAQFFVEDTEWFEVLNASQRALNKGGYLLFDSRNPLDKVWEKWSKEKTYKEYKETSHGNFATWTVLLEASNNKALYELHYLMHDTGEELVSTNKLVYRSYDQICRSLVDNGFEVINVYGGWDGYKYNSTSEEMIFIAKKKER